MSLRTCVSAALIAAAAVALSWAPASPTVAEPAHTIVTYDSDLLGHLQRRDVARGRLYRAVHRREWAGAAAGLMAAARTGHDEQQPVAPVRTTSTTPPGDVWGRLAQCEATGDWGANTGNGYYGGLQFTLGTWRAYGGVGMPNEASASEQIAVAERVLAGQGPGAWPVCSYRAGLR